MSNFMFNKMKQNNRKHNFDDILKVRKVHLDLLRICYLTFDSTFLNLDSLKLLYSTGFLVLSITFFGFTSTFGGDFFLSSASIFNTAYLYFLNCSSYLA